MTKQHERDDKKREPRQGERERQAPKPDDQFRTGERRGENDRRSDRDNEEERQR